jgi:trehalose 6-phosphate synthase/phosphatase
VYVVSGRGGEILERWLGDLPIGLVCEHGYAMRLAGERDWEVRQTAHRGAVRSVEELFEEFVRRTPGSMIERKRSSIAWHYRSADPEYGTFQANELLSLLEDTLKRRPYSVLRGNRVIEVRPENVTKGHAVTDLLQIHADADAVFCAGDDRTDEDMMEAINKSWRTRAVTCWVGGRNSAADFWVESSDALLGELSALVRMWTEERRQARGRRNSKGRTSPSGSPAPVVRPAVRGRRG